LKGREIVLKGQVQDTKKELAYQASFRKRAGDGTRTRDSLLGKQEGEQISFSSAFTYHSPLESTCAPLQGVMHGK
jgi:hypothetical protein